MRWRRAGIDEAFEKGTAMITIKATVSQIVPMIGIPRDPEGRGPPQIVNVSTAKPAKGRFGQALF
jgi:hypothetical protein